MYLFVFQKAAVAYNIDGSRRCAGAYSICFNVAMQAVEWCMYAPCLLACHHNFLNSTITEGIMHVLYLFVCFCRLWWKRIKWITPPS
jgi:hypothetical protein